MVYSSQIRPRYGNGLTYEIGISLSAKIRDKNITLEQAKKWFVQITLGAYYLHSRSIIHGKIEPKEIIIDEKDNAILLPFVFNPKRGDYSAPESSDGFKSTKVDVWSIG